MDTLLKNLELRCKPLLKYIQSIHVQNYCAPTFAQSFLASLASKSPLNVYIPITDATEGLLCEIVNGNNVKQDPVRWRKIQELLPVIATVLAHNQLPLIPIEFRELTADLMQKAKSIFAKYFTLPDEPPIMDDQLQSLSFFPSLPSVRSRPAFAADKQRYKDKVCSKRYKGHPTLLPGIFAIFCHHGVFCELLMVAFELNK